MVKKKIFVDFNKFHIKNETLQKVIKQIGNSSKSSRRFYKFFKKFLIKNIYFILLFFEMRF